MRLLIFSFVAIILSSCSNALTTMTIPAGETVIVDAPKDALSSAELKNKSFQQLEVGVTDKDTGKTLRGFGLNKKGKVKVDVENTSQLVLQNTQNKDIKLGVRFSPTTPQVRSQNNSVSFKLINPSAKSIPLIIPNVMNPNLSPFSESGVDLKIGQEILFRQKGKKYVLLTVSNEIQNGEKVNVRKLLNERKKELGI